MKKRVFVFVSLLGALTGVMTQFPVAWLAPHVMPKGIGENIRYSGTVWNGNISGLDYIGNAHFKLNPKAFVTGGLPLTFQSSSNAMLISTKASPTRIEDLRFSGQLANLPTRDGRLKELKGEVNIFIENLKFDKDCKSASGRANTDFLSLNQSRWQWVGPVLSGPIRCEGGDLIAELSGSENAQTIKANLHIVADGSYRADISVRTPQPEAGVVLPLYGFENRNGVYQLTEQGKWR